MSVVPHALLRPLARWFKPAPDSLAMGSIRRDKSPWVDAIHLLWTAWLFLTPILDRGSWNLRWVVITAVSYPLFLYMYARCVVSPLRWARAYAIGMILLCLVLMPWYPSGMTYFVFGCVMLRVGGMRFRRYAATLVVANVSLLLAGWLLHYPWQVTGMMALLTFVIGLIVNTECLSQEKDAELRLSHDEVRRLAATAERERIGRDLHDLLGHTLSLITLKLELSRKLYDRDPQAACREMEEAEQVARHALAEVRSAVTGIRAADLAAELASARLLLGCSSVHLDHGQVPAGLPAELERGLALVLREAVTNIARHAQATRAMVSMEMAEGMAKLCIEDDGRGGIGARGNGLSGMQERVHAMGGMLAIDSPSGHGSRLCIEVPLPRLSASCDHDAAQGVASESAPAALRGAA